MNTGHMKTERALWRRQGRGGGNVGGEKGEDGRVLEDDKKSETII